MCLNSWPTTVLLLKTGLLFRLEFHIGIFTRPQITRYKQCSEETQCKRKMKSADVSANDSSSGDSSCASSSAAVRLTKADRRFNAFVAKQDQALRVSIYLLLNLAEKTDVEEKMKRKGVVRMLVALLERKCNVELLILVVSFLKKLSCYASNMVLISY